MGAYKGLLGRFVIIRSLGGGGMGTVFLAEQAAVGNRQVALKVLHRKFLDDPEFLTRFRNEAASTGRVHHPNVVTIYDSGQADDGTPYIAMEFLEGETLRNALKTRGPLSVAEYAGILQQAARGLHAAHKLGTIHRDLKPENIFLARGDEDELIIKVVDFGIAKLRESANQTLTGTVLGTPAYMSYEQAGGMKSDELDARSDIYSLGVVAYESVTGRLPFQSDTTAGYLLKHREEAPPPFRTVAPSLFVAPQVETVVIKALMKNRDERYGSVLEFAHAFADAAKAARRIETATLLPTTLVSRPKEAAQARVGTRTPLATTEIVGRFVNAAALLAVYPDECYTSTSFLEADFRGGRGCTFTGSPFTVRAHRVGVNPALRNRGERSILSVNWNTKTLNFGKDAHATTDGTGTTGDHSLHRGGQAPARQISLSVV